MQVSAVHQTVSRPEFDDPVLRAGRGSAEAFEVLYRKHAGRVHALCRRLCGDPARAEDLTQETFARAWELRRSARPGDAYAGWICRIAIHLSLHEARGRMRREKRESPIERVDGFGDRSAPRPGGAIDLEAAIARLPEGARRVFVLHDVEGYRHGEVAGLLGISTGTTKAQLHRARRLLREALAGTAVGGPGSPA